MSSAAEKANLARIRDNQRRSRARRKEYLQELEARLRQCEVQGIEASAEIQVAARAVADENKKLRVLLNQQGISHETIEAALHNEALLGFAGGDHGAAVQTLEHLLATKKSFTCDTACGTTTVNPSSRDSSVSTVQSMWSSSYDRRPSERLSLSGQGQPHSQPHQFVTPHASGSRTSSMNLGRSVSIPMPGAQSQQMSRMSTMPGNASSDMVRDQVNQNQHNMYDFDPSQMYHRQQHSAPNHQHQMPQHTGSYIPVSTSPNTNSCLYATDMITTMTGGDPNTVRQELGCDSGSDCHVDNNLVFNVMDRYTGSSI